MARSPATSTSSLCGRADFSKRESGTDRMTTTRWPPRQSTMAPPASRAVLAFALVGAALIVGAVDASLTAQQWIVAGIAGAAGMALWRRALVGRVARRRSCCSMRSHSRFSRFSATTASASGNWSGRGRTCRGSMSRAPRSPTPSTSCGSLFALLTRIARCGRSRRSASIAIPFLFNLVVVARRRLAHGGNRRAGAPGAALLVSGAGVRRPDADLFFVCRGGAGVLS